MKYALIRFCTRPVAPVIIILCVFAICQFSIFGSILDCSPNTFLALDSPSYINTALALLRTGHFAIHPNQPNVPQLYRTPGYPLFIAATYRMFGERNLGIIFLQLIINLAMLLLVYSSATLLWDRHVALISIILLALDIPSFIHSYKILSETLFNGLLYLSLFFALSSLKYAGKRLLCLFSHGLFLGLATLVRPISYYLLLPLGVGWLLIYRYQVKGSWLSVIAGLMVVMLPWGACIGPWLARNYSLTGKAEFSYIQGANLLFYKSAGVISQRDSTPLTQAQQQLGYGHYAELFPETRTWNQAQLDSRWKQEGLRIVTAYPWFFLKNQIIGALTMLFGPPAETDLFECIGFAIEDPGPAGDLGRLSVGQYVKKWLFERTGQFALFCVAEIHLLLLYLSAGFAFWRLFTTPTPWWRVHILLLIIMGYFIAVSAGPGAYSRFRIPIMPLVAMYAGFGLSQRIKVCRFVRIPLKPRPTRRTQ